MREVGLFVNSLVLDLLRHFQKYKKTALTFLALVVCIIIYSFLKAYVQPADALSVNTTTVIGDSFNGDTLAYYCNHHRLQGPTVVAVCQDSAVAANALVASEPLMAATYANGCRMYDAIFRQYAWNVSVAEAVCQAESGGNLFAVSPTNDYGLMQLHNMAIFEPSQNIASAYRKYLVQGWGAWTTYNTGAYERYL